MNNIHYIRPVNKFEDLPKPESLGINFNYEIAMSYNEDRSEKDRFGRQYFWVCEHGVWGDEPIINSEHRVSIENTVLPINPTFLHDAIDKWGDEAQILLAIEECSELIQALVQTFRNSKDPDVITEIADVLITVSQMRELFGRKEVDAEIERKIERTKKKLYG